MQNRKKNNQNGSNHNNRIEIRNNSDWSSPWIEVAGEYKVSDDMNIHDGKCE